MHPIQLELNQMVDAGLPGAFVYIDAPMAHPSSTPPGLPILPPGNVWSLQVDTEIT